MLDGIPAEGSPIFRVHLGTVIGPHKVLTMLRGTTRLALNDDYGFVQMRYPDGNLADQAKWDGGAGRRPPPPARPW